LASKLGKLRADGIGAPAPRMPKNALFRYGHRFPFATVPKHKCYKTLWLRVRARKLSGIEALSPAKPPPLRES